MQFTTTLLSLILSVSTVAAQNSICGSQIYQPGTGQCFNGLLCLYQTNPSTGVADIITYPCGTVCYNAANYVCNNGVLAVATGSASIAVLTSTAAQTNTAGATASATPVQSGVLASSQSRAASVAASAASTSSKAATSSTAAKTSGAEKVRALGQQYITLAGAASLAILAGLVL